MFVFLIFLLRRIESCTKGIRRNDNFKSSPFFEFPCFTDRYARTRKNFLDQIETMSLFIPRFPIEKVDFVFWRNSTTVVRYGYYKSFTSVKIINVDFCNFIPVFVRIIEQKEKSLV